MRRMCLKDEIPDFEKLPHNFHALENALLEPSVPTIGEEVNHGEKSAGKTRGY